jgi:hypothetical protein
MTYMNMHTRLDTDLIVRSFDHVARKMAHSAQYEHILAEAEKHRSALRMMQRDVFETTESELRRKLLTKSEFQQLREMAAQRIAQGHDAITRIAAQYAPQRMAA